MTTRLLRLVAIGAGMLVPLLLGGCSLFGKDKTPPCPRVSIFGDTAQRLQFQPGPGRDASDVVWSVDMVDYDGTCSFSSKNTIATVSFVLRIAATRGPAAPAGDASLQVPYFVAVVDRQQNIISEETFNAKFTFASGRRRIAIGDELEQRIPLNGFNSTDYEVLVGLKLDADQVEYNRKQRGF